MVIIDLSWLQPVSWVATATGVCVAAFYYSLNLRETTRNRRASSTQSMLQIFSSYERFRKLLKLYEMKWENFDDFKGKYDSVVNPDNVALRHEIWDTCDVLGNMWKEGILDKNTIYNVGGSHISTLFIKFKPILEEYRRTEMPRDQWSSWEYLASEMDRITLTRDSEYSEKRLKGPYLYNK